MVVTTTIVATSNDFFFRKQFRFFFSLFWIGIVDLIIAREIQVDCLMQIIDNNVK